MSFESIITRFNDLQKGQNSVFYQALKEQDFNYSDGQQTEQLLEQILLNANDLSSQSTELQQQIIDWPTEYHLSETRCNLLKTLDLKKYKRVLELGCGCGSITRYLAEHSHLQIDAIEGSPVRAKLAALRCRDLDNVNIITANFNEIHIPEGHYDLVLFVGVTEYAGRFSDRETDQQALQDLLKIAHRATSYSGATVIAIENRVGLKYLMGANEDHYAVPYIGLHNYPESTGIRTYTKTEWKQQVKQSGFTDYQFYYPFPDYKVPTVVLDEESIKNEDLVAESLAGIRSRDYATAFSMGDLELTYWKALANAKTLGDHANSFLIVLAKNVSTMAQLLKPTLFKTQPSWPDYLSAN